MIGLATAVRVRGGCGGRGSAVVLLAVLLLPGSAPDLRAQAEGPLRGGAFELGTVVGSGTFEGKSRLSSCTWFGVRAGHRFGPFGGNERLQLTFRTGWEGCMTEHSETGGIDVIYVNVTLLLGLNVARSWQVYWGAGSGMLLGDSTPGSADKVEPRPSVHFGPGLTWALSDRFLVDVSAFAIIFENFKLGTDPQGGGVVGLFPSLMFAVQI